MMSQTEQLQQLWDELVPPHMEAEIIYKPKIGWYAIPDEARHFYDKGEYLGLAFEDAKIKLDYLKRALEHDHSAAVGASE